MKTRDKAVLIAAAIIGGMVVLVGLVALVYALTIEAGIVGARVWATAATLALPVTVYVTYRLATHATREHLAGFTRGLDGAERTIQSVGRGLSATASMARTAARSVRPGQANDDLLPKVGTMRLIDAPDSNDLIDL